MSEQKLYPCCQAAHDEQTLIMRDEDQNPERPDITVRRCPTCSRRHILAIVEKGNIGLHGGSIGV